MDLESSSMLLLVATSLGLISVFNTVRGFPRWVWITFWRSPKSIKEYGSWALITGSTDGIGKALAFEFAREGLNLVLVGRNPSKLEAVSDEILVRHRDKGIKVKIIVADFSADAEEEIKTVIEKGIEGLDVGILINNAGTGYPCASFLHEVDSDVLKDVIRVNIKGTTWVTRAVLPIMLRKKKGAIVNMSSGSSSVASSFPLHTVYAATKSYIDQFSRSLSVEYKQHGIDVQCQFPLYVATKMVKSFNQSLLVPTPETYATACMRWIGYECCCSPYWLHSVQSWFVATVLPEAVLDHWLLRHYLHYREIGQPNISINNS